MPETFPSDSTNYPKTIENIRKKWQTSPSPVLSAPPSQLHRPSTNLSRRKTSSAYKNISSPRANPRRQLPSQLQPLFQTCSLYRPNYATSYLHLHQQRANTAPSALFTKFLQYQPPKTSKHQPLPASSPSHISYCSPFSPSPTPLRRILPATAPYGTSSTNYFRKSTRSSTGIDRIRQEKRSF